ncbi:MAG: GNAT family N-acetyltransferase [Thermoplasmatota archaeon]
MDTRSADTADVTVELHPLAAPRDLEFIRTKWCSWLATDEAASLSETPNFAAYHLREKFNNVSAGLAVATEPSGEPVGVLPYLFERSLLGFPTRRLRTLGIGAVAHHDDPNRVRAAIVRGLMASLEPQPFGAEIEILYQPVATPPPPPRYTTVTVRPSAKNPGHIGIARDWNAFVDGHASARFRKHLRATRRRLAKEAWVLDDVTREAGEWISKANSLLDVALRTSPHAARRVDYRGSLRDDSFEGCFRELGLRVYALRRGDDTASIAYGARFRETFHLFRQGNDPRFFPDSPSLLLRVALIDRLINEGVTELDVVGGTTGHWVSREPKRRVAVFRRKSLAARLSAATLEIGSLAAHSPALRGVAHSTARFAPSLAARMA